jgi:hypothetical protein
MYSTDRTVAGKGDAGKGCRRGECRLIVGAYSFVDVAPSGGRAVMALHPD